MDDAYRPKRCECCGRLRPRRHGTYPRESDRINPSSHSLNQILIQRYYCPACRKTMSVLPECLPPNRWYPWDIQEVVVHLFLLGKTIYQIASEVLPSRHTIARWLKHFNNRFLFQKDALSTYFSELGRTSHLKAFWQTCLKKMRLSTAMRLCHVSGVAIHERLIHSSVGRIIFGQISPPHSLPVFKHGNWCFTCFSINIRRKNE